MRRLTLIALFAAVVMLAAACGSDSKTETGTSSPAATSETPAGASGAGTGTGGSTVKVSDTSLGEVLVDAQGMTLYVFTPDTGSSSTCNDACAKAWPPLAGPATAGDGVTAGDLATTTRTDGTTQVTYHGHPLYLYGGDAAAGDVTGQGVGNKWYVIGADGDAITSAGASSSSSSTSKPSSGY